MTVYSKVEKRHGCLEALTWVQFLKASEIVWYFQNGTKCQCIFIPMRYLNKTCGQRGFAIRTNALRCKIENCDLCPVELSREEFSLVSARHLALQGDRETKSEIQALDYIYLEETETSVWQYLMKGAQKKKSELTARRDIWFYVWRNIKPYLECDECENVSVKYAYNCIHRSSYPISISRQELLDVEEVEIDVEELKKEYLDTPLAMRKQKEIEIKERIKKMIRLKTPIWGPRNNGLIHYHKSFRLYCEFSFDNA